MPPSVRMAPELDARERAWLLGLARDTIAAAAAGAALPDRVPVSDVLIARAGVFVSLHIEGKLRGCIGQISASEALYRATVNAAVSAALHDPRFPPVTCAEVAGLEIEISVLSEMSEVEAGEAERLVEIGRHGLMIVAGHSRGLLLPQVASRYGWTAREFLEQTCWKAGLAPDAWRSGTRILMFTACIFADEKAAPYSNSTRSPTTMSF